MMSRLNEQLGRAFEGRLSASEHLPVWVKIPNNRDTRGNALASTWLDYFGVLPGGRAITADAKWKTDATRATSGILKPNQRDFADKALEAGTLTLVIVGWVYANEVRVSVIPWQEVRNGVDLVDWLVSDWGAACAELASRY